MTDRPDIAAMNAEMEALNADVERIGRRANELHGELAAFADRIERFLYQIESLTKSPGADPALGSLLERVHYILDQTRARLATAKGGLQ